MKYRPRTLAYMDILRSIRDHPLPPTRVAQAANIHYPRMAEYLELLEGNKLVARRIEEGHELVVITQDGLKVLEDFERVLSRLRPDLA